MVHFQLLLRLLKASVFLLVLAAIAVAVAVTSLSIVDLFACILAFIPTGWGILSVSSNLLMFFFFSARLVDSCYPSYICYYSIFQCYDFWHACFVVHMTD